MYSPLRTVLLAGVSGFGVLASTAALAATVPPPQALTAQQAAQLDDVVVTASGFHQRITQAPASISLLPREEIEELRASSIAEVLNAVEGVDTGAGVGKTGGQTINIRGMGSDYTLILIDGRRQNTSGSVTPNGFGETSTSFLPPVSSIERVEVVRGPVATLYGSDAMGGVINIITRKVGDSWRGGFTANYTLQGDDEFGNQWGTNGYASGPLVKDLLGLSLRGSWAEREQSDLKFRDVNGKEVDVTGFGRSATAYEIWNLGGRLNLTPGHGHELWLDADVSSQWYDNGKGQMGTLDTPATAAGYSRSLEFNREQYLLAHNWDLRFGTLESTLSYNATETIGRTLPGAITGARPVAGAGKPRTLETDTTVFDTKLNSQWRNHTFTVGGQYMDAQMRDGVANGNFTFEQWALFAEDELRFNDALALTLGVRYDNHSTFGDQVSPRAYLVWNANDQWTFKGGVSGGYKTPRLEQLTPGINGFGRQGTQPLIGTPSLKPETTTAYEVGAYFDNGTNLRANVTLFRNDFADKIAAGTPVANCSFNVSAGDYAAGNYNKTGCVDVGHWSSFATFGQSVNVDEAVTQGLEATARYLINDAWTVSGNYTFTDSEQKTGSNKGQPLTDTPEHMLNAQLRWTVNDRLSTWIRGEYRSERWRGDAAITAQIGELKAYELFHLGGSYRVSDTVSVNATIYNLLNKDFVRLLPHSTPVAYAPEYANNQEPRRLWVSVNVDF